MELGLLGGGRGLGCSRRAKSSRRLGNAFGSNLILSLTFSNTTPHPHTHRGTYNTRRIICRIGYIMDPVRLLKSFPFPIPLPFLYYLQVA